MRLSGAHEMQSGPVLDAWQSLQPSAHRPTAVNVQAPPIFGARDPTPESDFLSSAGRRARGRILAAVALARPDVEYAPQLPALTSLGLLYLDERSCCAWLQALLLASLPPHAQPHLAAPLLVGRDAACVAEAAVLLKVRAASPRAATALAAGDGSALRRAAADWLGAVWLGSGPLVLAAASVDMLAVEGTAGLVRRAVGAVWALRQRLCLAATATGGPAVSPALSAAEELASSMRHGLCPRALARASMDAAQRSAVHFADVAALAEPLRSAACETRSASSSGAGLALDAEVSSMARYSSGGSGEPFYLPSVWPGSRAATDDETQILWAWLPAPLRIRDARVVFSSARDGTALQTLYARAAALPAPSHCILLARGTCGSVVGAYLSGSPHLCAVTTGESFVFSLRPHAVRHNWTPARAEQAWLTCRADCLVVGGGALSLDRTLDSFSSCASPTFGTASPLITTPIAGQHSTDERGSAAAGDREVVCGPAGTSSSTSSGTRVSTPLLLVELWAIQ